MIPFSFFNVYRNTRKLSSHVRYLKSIEVQGCTSFIVFRNESIAQLVPLWTNLHVNIFAGTPLVNGRARATSYQLSAHSLKCLSLNNYFFHWFKESKNLGFWIPGSEIWVLDSNLKQIWDVFRIPKPRIPKSPSKMFPDSPSWGEFNVLW